MLANLTAVLKFAKVVHSALQEYIVNLSARLVHVSSKTLGKHLKKVIDVRTIMNKGDAFSFYNGLKCSEMQVGC